MSDFILVHVDTAGGLKPSAHQVAVAIGASGNYDWTDATCLGHPCLTSKEWDVMINRLKDSLENVRKQGHAKLTDNRRT